MKPEQAIEDLKIIRQVMSRTLPSMVMSGWQGISWGVVSLLGGTLTHHYCVAGTTSFTSPGISLLWILLLIVGGTAETFFYIRKARRNRISLLSPVVKNIMIGFINDENTENTHYP